MDRQVKYLLDESELPRQWYNVTADLPSPPPPPLHPGTREPVGPDDLAPLFPAALIGQEVSAERYIPIPEDVRDVYRLWRPTPLLRARRLEKDLGTPARIYYKYEGGSPAGSHKPNTAVPQAYYNAAEGVSRLITETGAGQWGSALAFASAVFGLQCEVFQVRASYDQKPYRRLLMETYGASVHPSPSDLTQSGKAVLAADPDSPGSLGIAISEAVEVAAQDPSARYALGSVLNHVLLHQTVIGEEAIKQLEQAGDVPDLIIGCTGGGSNFSGLVFPFLREKLAGRMNPVLRAVEPAACPSFTRGVYAYDFGDTAGTTSCRTPSTRAGCVTTACRRCSRTCTSWDCSRRWRSPSRSASRRACVSPGPRASCRRRSPPTRWPRASRRRCAARRPARRRSS
jgi:tryptophan synthase beta chain